jgi:hypothetical protein
MEPFSDADLMDGDKERRRMMGLEGELGMKRSERWLAVFCALWFGYSAGAALPTTWNLRNSGVSNRLNAVTYGNGLFVAAGASPNQVLISSEGINWSTTSTPATYGWFWGASYGAGRYVLVGDGSAFLRSSADGIQWTNGSSAPVNAFLRSVVYTYGQFVAVGCNSEDRPYVLTSSNGMDWTSQSVPGNSPLWAVCASGSASQPMYIAVGADGIFSSTNGRNWAVQSVDNTTLYDAGWHQGRFIVIGNDTSLTSSDGISWSPTAPLSFFTQHLGSSGADGALVAVGYYSGWGGEGYSGRLQASADGLTWPGDALVFSPALRGITYGGNSFVAVGDEGLILQSFVGPMPITNEWTKASSGNWEEMYWSLGVLPAADQQTVAIGNSGWKAVAIGANTTANCARSLTVNDLIIDAPTNSANQLLLNWAGLNVPLLVRSNLLVGTNGSIECHHSVILTGKTDLYGPVTFSDSSIANLNQLAIHSGASLNFNDTYAWCSNGISIDSRGRLSTIASVLLVDSGQVTIRDSTFEQVGGLVRATNGGIELFNSGAGMTNGVLEASSVGIMQYGKFYQLGGVARIGSLWLVPYFMSGLPGGTYTLADGELSVTGNVYLANSGFTQLGGTNQCGSLSLSANCPHIGDCGSSGYGLINGLLAAADVSVPRGSFYQEGGMCDVTNGMWISGAEVGPYGQIHYSTFTLTNGLLRARTFRLDHYSGFKQTGGNIAIAEEFKANDLRNYFSSFDNYSMELQGGTLSCSVMSVTNNADILLSGGAMTVSNTLTFAGIRRWAGINGYVDTAWIFSGGTLNASNIEAYGAWRIFGSSSVRRISNPGYFKLGGKIELNNTPINEYLGRLILADNSMINLSGCSNILRFGPSSGESWISGAILKVKNWAGLPAGGGTEQLSFGTNQSGLTTSQLGQIAFVDPAGWPSGSYPAQLLATGELVPAVLPPLAFSNTANALVLSWPVGYELLTATNVSGPYEAIPGAASPHTNKFTDPQCYFRLRLPAP